MGISGFSGLSGNTPPKKWNMRLTRVYSDSAPMMLIKISKHMDGTRMAVTSASRSQAICIKIAIMKSALRDIKIRTSDQRNQPWNWM